MRGSNIASSLVNIWLSSFEVEYQDDIVLASLYKKLETYFILASVVVSEGKEKNF